MNENKKFLVIDDKGKQVECEPLFTFESEETGKKYVVYTDHSLDKNGNTRVFASIYNMTETTLILCFPAQNRSVRRLRWPNCVI